MPASSFVESIGGRNLSLVNKNILLLIKQSHQNASETSSSAHNGLAPLDLKSMHALASQVDPINLANNSLGVFAWLKSDPKMKWDQGKPIRFNQDNQREDDLRRLREISNYLVKLKIGGETASDNKTTSRNGAVGGSTTTVLQKSIMATPNATVTYPGGMYCRIENEWKLRNN